MIQKKHIGLIIGIFLLIGIATTGYAQNERLMNIGEIELIPGTTIRPNDIKGDWTDEMYRQWFDELNRLMRESLRPNERPVITTPDFEKMTQDEIDAWRDSVINILYPNATIQRADKQTECSSLNADRRHLATDIALPNPKSRQPKPEFRIEN